MRDRILKQQCAKRMADQYAVMYFFARLPSRRGEFVNRRYVAVLGGDLSAHGLVFRRLVAFICCLLGLKKESISWPRETRVPRPSCFALQGGLAIFLLTFTILIMPKLSVRALGKELGISAGMVSRLAKAGMPMDDPAKAREWPEKLDCLGVRW